MRHLFGDWTRVSARLRAAPAVALFLDFDGTLARLRPRPEQGALDRAMRPLLATLARSPRFRVWIVSGRRLADVRSRVRVPGIRCLGLHGWEGPGSALSAATLLSVAALGPRLESGLSKIPGVWVEGKELAFTVHYERVADSSLPRTRRLVESLLEPCADRFRIQSGKKVWEILPRELEDKGAAVKHRFATLGGRAIAVYIGDDDADEPAFAALAHGITVRVGRPRPSRAQYRLSGVAEVRAFLYKLHKEMA